MNSQLLTTTFSNRSMLRLLLTGTLAWFATQSAIANATVSEQYDFRVGQTLKLDFPTGGSVKVIGSDQAGIDVTYGDHDHGLERYDIEFENTAYGLKVTAKLLGGYNTSGLEFIFTAPREMSVEIDSAGGGIELNGLVGDFSGRTGGGALIIKDVTGELDLRTGGGRILVQDSEVDGSVRTGGGKVLVENVIGDLDASSGGGEVKYRKFYSSSGTLASPTSRNLQDATEGTILMSNAGGKIDIDAAPEGADIKTGGGKILVQNANRFVSARTGGGDVEIELQEGWVDASTGAGDVDIVIANNSSDKGDVKVFTGLGDVTLVVPDDFSMDLYVELGVTNNTNKKFDVLSDFAADIDTDRDWDYTHGTPRKITRAVANVNGGQHRVEIYTTNGNVMIRKAN